jgi:hypothetical protein
MKSLPQALLLAMVLLLSGFASSVLAESPTRLNGAPVVAQYSGSSNSYGNSSSSSSRVRVRSYRGLFRLGALVVILIISGIGFLIRQLNAG